MNNSTVPKPHSSIEEQSRALNAQAWTRRKTDMDTARQLAEQSLALCRELLRSTPSSHTGKREAGTALLILAVIHSRLTDYNGALHLAEEALDYFEDIGHTAGIIHALAIIAGARCALGECARALELARQGLTLAEGLNDPEAEASVMNILGLVHWNLADYTQALDYFLRGLALLRDTIYRRDMLDIVSNLGMTYTSVGDYDKGLEYSTTALLLATECNDKAGEAVALMNIGILYFHQQEMEQAREHFFRSLALYRELLHRNGQMHTLVNLASVESASGHFDTAETYIHAALELAYATGNRRIEAYSLTELGQIAGRKGQYDDAAEHYRKSLAICRGIDYPLGEVHTLIALGTAASTVGHHSEALAALHEALLLAEQIEATSSVFDIHSHLADAYERSGDTAQALHHHRIFYKQQLDVFNRQALIRRESMRVFYEVEQAAREAEIYRLRNVELAAANTEILQQKERIEEHVTIIRKAHDELLDKTIALERMNHDKDEFIGIAVHGLKNPLSLIIMAASMLRKNSGFMSKEELDKNLEWIEVSAWRMEELVIKLLQSNAVESGTVSYNPELLDLSTVLAPLVQEYGERAAAKSIRLSVEGLSQAITVYADLTMARDIIDNLISNAVKFSPPDSAIHIRLIAPSAPDAAVAAQESDSPPPPVAQIVVQDEGPGISTEDQQRMFGKFERLSAKPTGGEHSTGLGLSIAKKLTELMGGRIWCNSAPGRGAAFTVELPATAPAVPQAQQ